MKELAKYLRIRSREICESNHCTEDEHHCESYAYFANYGDEEDDWKLIDICAPDFFEGVPCGMEYVAIPLPFEGGEEELRREIEENRVEEDEDDAV